MGADLSNMFFGKINELVAGYSEHVFDSLGVLAEESNVDAFSYQILSQVAKERGCFVCYGVPGKHRESGFTIRQVVLDDSGSLISIYDKIHLCDFGDGRETKWFRPGERLCYFDCKGFRVGILICADMRHTELSRELALGRSCDILLQPAAFARDVTYASWQSFVECRALENQVPLVHMFRRHTGEGNRFWMVFVMFLCSFGLVCFQICCPSMYVCLRKGSPEPHLKYPKIPYSIFILFQLFIHTHTHGEALQSNNILQRGIPKFQAQRPRYWAAVNYAGPSFGGSMWCPPWVDGKEKVTSRLGILGDFHMDRVVPKETTGPPQILMV